MIRRGCTPTIFYELLNEDNTPFDMSLIADMTVTISQYDKDVIKRHKSDIEINDNVISVHLTQEETLKLTTNTFVEIQPKFYLTSGEVIAPEIVRRSVNRILDEVVFE